MNSTSRFVLFALLASLGCTRPATNPMEGTAATAIQYAADHPLQGFEGLITLSVKNIDEMPRKIYLNSEEDYRSQQCLTVVLSPSLKPGLLEKLGMASIQDLKGRTIQVHGMAKRIKIGFMEGGELTNKYYFQTQININSMDQITLIQN